MNNEYLELVKKIEVKKVELIDIAAKMNNLLVNELVVEKSQELDELINQLINKTRKR